MLEILQIPAGSMDNFSYLIWCSETREAIGVDPSLEPEKMLAALAEHQLTMKTLVNTHGHHDHIAGNETILNATNAHLAAHPLSEVDSDMSIDEGAVLTVATVPSECCIPPAILPARSLSIHPVH